MRKPKPTKPPVPGQKAGPTKLQKKAPQKRPWTRAEEIGKRVVDSINPFD
jgi:hypothetical protein